MQTLTVGSNSYEVMFLQVMLNRSGANPRLAEDGIFGPRTQAAAIAFQRANTVSPANGTVAVSTWQRFGPITERMHNIVGYSQPTDTTCWSAAATMMTGTNASYGPGNATNTSDGGLDMGVDKIETFVN